MLVLFVVIVLMTSFGVPDSRTQPGETVMSGGPILPRLCGLPPAFRETLSSWHGISSVRPKTMRRQKSHRSDCLHGSLPNRSARKSPPLFGYDLDSSAFTLGPFLPSSRTVSVRGGCAGVHSRWGGSEEPGRMESFNRHSIME